VRILQRLADAGEASPSELADALGEPLGNVSYHVRVLRELNCLELVRTEPRRGALEHFYRATVSPWLSEEQWARLPAGFRRKTLPGTLAEIAEAGAEASRRGAFERPEAHVSRVVLALDEASTDEIDALLDETREAALRINAASAARQAEHGPGAPPPVTTELALIHVRRAKTS
jgi:DNA-binding transcriptional ArsR family regulator